MYVNTSILHTVVTLGSDRTLTSVNEAGSIICIKLEPTQTPT